MGLSEDKVMLAVAQLRLAASDYEMYQAGRNPTPQKVRSLLRRWQMQKNV